jgi:RimJ/RimL family protein N-acetyltransferase
MARRLEALELVGVRACLRLHRPEDAAPAYALLAGCDEILRWLVWDGPAAVAELAEHYRHACSSGQGAPDLRLAIVERAGGALAGSLALRFEGHAGLGDVGYWVGLPFQRRGIGGEALLLAAHLAFAHLAADALEARVFVGNEASRRVLERAGFTLSHTSRGTTVKGGVRMREWRFVLLYGEWRRLGEGYRPRVETLRWVSAGEDDRLESAARPLPGG